jgi:hypothetical protein
MAAARIAMRVGRKNFFIEIWLWNGGILMDGAACFKNVLKNVL